MSVYSMTGYANAQSGPSQAPNQAGAAGRLNIEIRSVNSRFLDLAFRLPDELRASEPALRELLTATLKRGKVELRASLENDSTSTLQAPDVATLKQIQALQEQIKASLPEASPLSVSSILQMSSSMNRGTQDHSQELLELTKQTIKGLLAAREREGAKLTQMMLERTKQLRALAMHVVPLVPQLVEQQKQRFLERWAQAMALTDGAANHDAAQDRALTESTAFAIRIDVAEEVSRLSSHLDEIERLLSKGGEVGKRLDFLIQELHREANTLGSKATSLELSHVAVDMKVLIEQIREQVQNLE